MSDDVELYDIPPIFQNRLLKWLETYGALTVSVVGDKFLVGQQDRRTGSSEHKNLEHALNHAMGSRAANGHISKAFQKRVHAWLTERNAKIRIHEDGGEFVLKLITPGASIETVDKDLEVALVLAEDELELQTGDVEPETLEAPTRAAHTRRMTFEEEPETIAAPTRMAETRAAPTKLFEGEDRTLRETGLQENARWSRAYVNSLPDSAFLYVESGGQKDKIGRSHPLSLRALPYKNRSGRVDRAHLKAALSRAHQSKTVIPESKREQIFRRAEEVYQREFGDEPMAANPPPRRPSVTLGGRELPSPEEIIRREEARERRDERPFDPEARRESYAKSHHFAVNAATRFGDLPVGATFVFAIENERTMPSGMALGPWVKVSARKYRHESHRPEDVHTVGTVSAQVLRTDHTRERHADKDVLREVMLDDTGYVLVLWDTHRTDRLGKSILGYAFYAPENPEPLFEGEDFGASPMDAVDSDETVRGLLGFLTLRPGDTDREYFDGYSERQMNFARGDAEMLSLFGMEPDSEFEPPPLVDVET